MGAGGGIISYCSSLEPDKFLFPSQFTWVHYAVHTKPPHTTYLYASLDVPTETLFHNACHQHRVVSVELLDAPGYRVVLCIDDWLILTTFSVLQYFMKNSDVAAELLASPAISLPLSTLWISASSKRSPCKSREPHLDHKVIPYAMAGSTGGSTKFRNYGWRCTSQHQNNHAIIKQSHSPSPRKPSEADFTV